MTSEGMSPNPSPLAGEGGARAAGVERRGVGRAAAVEIARRPAGRSAADPADQARTFYLEGRGFKVLRFWNNEILNNPDGVAAAIRAALETPLPNSSSARSEGLNGAIHG